MTTKKTPALTAVALGSALFTCAALLPAHAEDCTNTAHRTANSAGPDIKRVVIEARAGDLVVRGGQSRDVTVDGKACASSKELLEQIKLEIRRDGDTVYLRTVMPDLSDVFFGFSRYAYLDVTVGVPKTATLTIDDSSGDMEVSDVQGASITDSSGDQAAGAHRRRPGRRRQLRRDQDLGRRRRPAPEGQLGRRRRERRARRCGRHGRQLRRPGHPQGHRRRAHPQRQLGRHPRRGRQARRHHRRRQLRRHPRAGRRRQLHALAATAAAASTTSASRARCACPTDLARAQANQWPSSASRRSIIVPACVR